MDILQFLFKFDEYHKAKRPGFGKSHLSPARASRALERRVTRQHKRQSELLARRNIVEMDANATCDTTNLQTSNLDQHKYKQKRADAREKAAVVPVVDERRERLKRWKADKEERLKKEKAVKKPVFRAGAVSNVGFPGVSGIGSFAPKNTTFTAPKNIQPIPLSLPKQSNTSLAEKNGLVARKLLSRFTRSTRLQNKSISTVNSALSANTSKLNATLNQKGKVEPLKNQNTVRLQEITSANKKFTSAKRKSTENKENVIQAVKGIISSKKTKKCTSKFPSVKERNVNNSACEKKEKQAVVENRPLRRITRSVTAESRRSKRSEDAIGKSVSCIKTSTISEDILAEDVFEENAGTAPDETVSISDRRRKSIHAKTEVEASNESSSRKSTRVKTSSESESNSPDIKITNGFSSPQGSADEEKKATAPNKIPLTNSSRRKSIKTNIPNKEPNEVIESEYIVEHLDNDGDAINKSEINVPNGIMSKSKSKTPLTNSSRRKSIKTNIRNKEADEVAESEHDGAMNKSEINVPNGIILKSKSKTPLTNSNRRKSTKTNIAAESERIVENTDSDGDPINKSEINVPNGIISKSKSKTPLTNSSRKKSIKTNVAAESEHIVEHCEQSELNGTTPRSANLSPERNTAAPVVYVSPFVVVSRGKESARREAASRRRSAAPEDDTAAARYYLAQLDNVRSRLEAEADTWEERALAAPPDARDMIDAAVGQTRLLCSKKFEQFRGLVGQCGGEAEDGCPVHAADLRGFWDMVYLQVVQLDTRYERLSRQRDEGWAEVLAVAPPPPQQPPRRRAAPARPRPKVAASRPARSGLRDAIKAARERAASAKTASSSGPGAGNEVVFDGGFFTVKSPVRGHTTPRTPRGGGGGLLTAVLSAEARRRSAAATCSPLAAMRVTRALKATPTASRATPTPARDTPTPARSILKKATPGPAPHTATKVVLFKDELDPQEDEMH